MELGRMESLNGGRNQVKKINIVTMASLIIKGTLLMKESWKNRQVSIQVAFYEEKNMVKEFIDSTIAFFTKDNITRVSRRATAGWAVSRMDRSSMKAIGKTTCPTDKASDTMKEVIKRRHTMLMV